MKLILLHIISNRNIISNIFFTAVCLSITINASFAQATNTGNVYIPTGGNVYLDADFTNSPTGGLQFQNNGDFSLTGDFTNDESAMLSGTGIIRFKGTSLQNISGSQALNVYNFELKNSANIQLGNNLKITGTFYPSTGALQLNGNTLTLNGTIDNSIGNTGTISGSSTSDLTISGSSTSLGTLNFTTGFQTYLARSPQQSRHLEKQNLMEMNLSASLMSCSLKIETKIERGD